MRILCLQIFFVYFTDSFNALSDRLVKLVSARLWIARIDLNEQKCGTHFELLGKLLIFTIAKKNCGKFFKNQNKHCFLSQFADFVNEFRKTRKTPKFDIFSKEKIRNDNDFDVNKQKS